jgi:uncharacterized protein YciI
MVQTETQPHELWMVSYVLVEHSSADPDDSLWREHLAHLQAGYGRGIVVRAGPFDRPAGGVVGLAVLTALRRKMSRCSSTTTRP